MIKSNFFSYKSTSKELTLWCKPRTVHACDPNVLAYSEDN